ncbi:MAG: ABC transporter ATP-binding protein [Bacilli bacterium]|nr:ABC transporter ATP-binding protein [Bacilli bacterium]MBP5551161.1 ABC transporter ATP-binding protein [Bacilli bacterium]
MKKVLEYVKPYTPRMLIGLMIKIFGTLMDLVIPYILSFIIDELVPLGEIRPIIIYGIIMIGCSAACFLGNMFANQMASRVAMMVTTDLRHDLFKRIEDLSPKQMDDITIPSLISRMNNDTYNVHHFVGMIQRLGVRAPILLVGGIIVTFTLNVKLTLVLLAVLPFIVLITVFISKKGIPLYTDIQNASDDMVRDIRESVTGIRVIKALSKTEYEKERFSEVNQHVIDNELKAGYMMARLSPLINLCLNIGLVSVLVVGAYLVIGGDTKVGKIIAFISYFHLILNAMLSVTRIFTMSSRTIASAKRIEAVFSLDEDLKKEDINEEDSDIHVEFKNVNFSYNGKIDNLTDINFALKKGESLGIIGPTGSGKTTIISLLLRLYDIGSGQILIDGKDIRSMEDEELKKKFGVAFQNDILFSASIKDNIKFNRDLTDDQVIKAIEVAQATDTVFSKKEGLDYMIAAKGTNVSGGQKQRLLIARAIANNPDILILDDSSSALDYKTDANLRKALKEFNKDTTTIIISERISSIINCNHILLLEDGKQVGYGTHNDLLASSKEYLNTYKLQMGDEHE